MTFWLWAVLAFLGAKEAGAGNSVDFKVCERNPNVKVLEVLPGGGWDNLRNKEMGMVMSLNYSQCQTTEDGEYLIPNDVFVVPLKKSRVEVHSDFIQDWVNYTDAFAKSINAEASFFFVLNGKFSDRSQETKMHNIYDETITTRVQVRYHMYSVKARPSMVFSEEFRHQLVNIGNHLVNNQSQYAQYLAQMLVLNYGTHVLTDVEAGASLIQEDQVKRRFVLDKVMEMSGISASASATFFSKINVGLDFTTQHWDNLTKSYLENTVDSTVEGWGSVPFYPGITLQKWQEGIPNRLVAIGKSGLPLTFFITPKALPELPEPAVWRVRAAVKKAIRLYYAVNTHPGCLRSDSSNFNFQANVDDGSCQSPSTNFTFGGVFQECQGVSGSDTKELCQAYRVQNPVTGNGSCPANFTPVLLQEEQRTVSKPKSECRKVCDSCYLIFICCDTVCGIRYYSSTVKFKAYWCAATSQVAQNSGLLFGGLYSTGSENPLTKTSACPAYFFPLELFDNLKVCVSSDYEMGSRFAVPFGGFFSCQSGNPLAGLLKGQSPGVLQDFFYQASPTEYPMKCPIGYSQHKAFLSDGCEILYCLQAGTLFAKQLAPIKLPPFSKAPSQNSSVLDTILVRSDGTHAWVRSLPGGDWRLVNVTSKEMVRAFQGQFNPKLSGGGIAGITISAIVAVMLVIVALVYGRRRHKNKGYQEITNEYLVHEEENYGATSVAPENGSI